MWDSILGLQDHTLSQRQTLNQLSHSAAPLFYFSIELSSVAMHHVYDLVVEGGIREECGYRELLSSYGCMILDE